jgi:hypothetical protein
MVRNDKENYHIGTANKPVNVSSDYANHVHLFHELGSWTDIEDAESPALANLMPVGASLERSSLLVNRGLSDEVAVYVLYIYHTVSECILMRRIINRAYLQTTSSLWDEAPTETTSLAMAAMPAAPAISPAPSVGITHTPGPALNAPASSGPPNPIDAYLQQRFGQRLQQIRHVRTLTCGTAYRHCTEEKHFIVVCASLGLNLAQREFQPVYADGHRISYDDVVRAMGLVKNTLSNTRTHVTKARNARRSLARIIQQQEQMHRPVVDEAEALRNMERKDLLAILDALLGERDIEDSFLVDSPDSPQARAIHMSYESFKTQVTRILTNEI